MQGTGPGSAEAAVSSEPADTEACMDTESIPGLRGTTGPLSQRYIDAATPMGGRLLNSGMGATFKVWAPGARRVDLLWDYVRSADGDWQPRRRGSLLLSEGGIWTGYVPRLTHGDRYMFYVVGPEGGTEGLKRDPYALDLSDDPAWPQSQCLLYNTASFPWHDQSWKPPAYHQLCIYQLHVGTWYIPRGSVNGTFLDIIERLPYLRALQINAIQLLPIVEFPTQFSLGYNGVDYFSPETDYGVKADDPSLPARLQRINALLAEAGPALRPYEIENIQGTANQLRMLVDMCHVFGLAVILDVVYNHAGGDFGDRSLYFFDRRPYGDNNDSLYFTDRGWAGGLVFAYWKNEVKQFLIDNAVYYLRECHCDGLRYDEVSVIKNEGGEHGWKFCQYVTDTCHYVKPEAIHIAESWPVEQAIVSRTAHGGAGFDATHNDGLRNALRWVIAEASRGADAFVDMHSLAAQIASPVLREAWRAVQHVENHDLVRVGRRPRIAALADAGNHRSWYARSRSRVAMGVVVTAVGIPHLFMGQEILEDKPWHDEPGSGFQIWWQGLEQDRAMRDFLRFTSELLAVRRSQPALQASGLNLYHVHDHNRVLAFHRWVEGEGQDVVVVVSLNESTFSHYDLGFPRAGYWRELFNSDFYDHWPNPRVAGNRGAVHAGTVPMHGLDAGATIVIPANSILIFKWQPSV